MSESGPDHAKTFHATAVLAGQAAGEGDGRSKKEAEQRAAEQAWTALSPLIPDTPLDADSGEPPLVGT